MTIQRITPVAVLLAAVLAMGTRHVQAGIIFTFSDGITASGQIATYGFDFTPVQDITVDSLGFFDFGQDGLASSHGVGIWAISDILTAGPLLASTTVTTANSLLSGPVINGGQYRFTPIAGLNLSSGTTYRFGAAIEGASDAWYAAGTNISASPSLALVSSTGFYKFGGGLLFPDQQVGNGYAAGSFTATPTNAVPEPSSLALWSGLGLMGLIAARRRKRASPQLPNGC